MTFKLTEPETQDIEALKTLYTLTDTFCCEAAEGAPELTPEKENKLEEIMEETMDEKAIEIELEGLVTVLENLTTAPKREGSEDRKILAELRILDFGLRIAFEGAAAARGAQERALTFFPQDLESEVNKDLIEKYELTGLATLVQKATAPDPS